MRFQISNDNIAQTDWLIAKAGRTELWRFGPARVILNMGDFKYGGGNVLVLTPENDDTISYAVYSDKQKKMINSGRARRRSL